MTRALGKPEPVPYVDEEDLELLAVDMGAGWFSSADLYRWHSDQINDDDPDRKPVGRTMFGRALREAGWKEGGKYLNGRMTRCWMITLPWVRRGQARLDAKK